MLRQTLPSSLIFGCQVRVRIRTPGRSIDQPGGIKNAKSKRPPFQQPVSGERRTINTLRFGKSGKDNETTPDNFSSSRSLWRRISQALPELVRCARTTRETRLIWTFRRRFGKSQKFHFSCAPVNWEILRPHPDFPEFPGISRGTEHSIKFSKWIYANGWQIPGDSWMNWSNGIEKR